MEIKNEKLKKILSNVGAALKKTAFVFNSEFAIPAAFSILLFLMISTIIILENTVGEYQELSEVFSYLSFSCFAGILAASISVFFTKKKWIHAICGAAALGIARFLIYISVNDYTPGIMLEYFGFLIVLAIMFMFVIYSGTKKDEALLYVFAKFVQSTIIANFIATGFAICEALFFNFVVDEFGKFGTVVFPITYVFCVCIVGLFYFFANIHTDSQDNPPLSKMEKGWYHYCLSIIFSVYIFVLYAYFIKIIFVRTLPEGIIGYFVSIATAAYMFMYFSQKQFNDAWTKWFYKIGAYIMLPLIVMQCLAIYQRISAYGFTGTRICNIGCVLITLVFIALTFYKQGLHIRKIFPFAAIIIFLLMIQPFGAQRIAIIQQTAHFERLLIKNGIWDKKTLVLTPLNFTKENPPDAATVEELNSICSIYNYLEERNSLPEYCKGKRFSYAFGFEKNRNGKYDGPKTESPEDFKDYKWEKEFKFKDQTIDVSNFNRVFYKEVRKYEKQKKLYIEVFNEYNVLTSFDVTDFILESIPKMEGDVESLRYEIDDNTTVEFVRIYFSYNKQNFKDFNLTYYILMK